MQADFTFFCKKKRFEGKKKRNNRKKCVFVCKSFVKTEKFAIIEDLGGIPERSKGPDCKSGGSAFAGSNPAPSTTRDLAKVLRNKQEIKQEKQEQKQEKPVEFK